MWLRAATHGRSMPVWVLGCEQAWAEQAWAEARSRRELRAGVGRASVEQASAQSVCELNVGSEEAAGGHARPLDAYVGVRLRAGVGRAGVGRAGVGCEQAWAERAWSTSKRAPYMQAYAV